MTLRTWRLVAGVVAIASVVMAVGALGFALRVRAAVR